MINKLEPYFKKNDYSLLFIFFLLFCFQSVIFTPESGFGKVKNDIINPFGEIKGIKDSYKIGEVVEFEILANDNSALRKIVFQVKGSNVYLSLNPQTSKVRYKYSFNTKGWEKKAYIYTLFAEDMSGNTLKYQGIFFLKSPKTQDLNTKLLASKIINAVYSLGKNNYADFFHVTANKEVIRIGEFVSYHFRSEKSCYLLLLNIGAGGNLVQIFPNGFNPESYIKAYKRYVVPGKTANMKLEVTGPPGREAIIAIVSETPFNLFPADFENSPFFILDKEDQELLKKIRKNIRNVKFQKFSQKIMSYSIK